MDVHQDVQLNLVGLVMVIVLINVKIVVMEKNNKLKIVMMVIHLVEMVVLIV